MREAQVFHLREKHYEKRELFFKARNRKKLFAGSNQIAKTTSILAELIACCLQFRPWAPEEEPLVVKEKGRCILAGPNFKHWASENVMPKIRELIPWDVCIEKTESQGTDITKLHFYTGWTIKILSYEQDKSVYESWTCDALGLDEAPPFEMWGGLTRGCIIREAPIIIAYTPWGANTPWTHDALFLKSVFVKNEQDLKAAKDAESICVQALMEDNPYLTEAQRNWYREELKDRPEEYRARIEGQYSIFMGRVYTQFDVAKHIRPLEAFF